MTALLAIEGLTVRRDGCPVLDGATLALGPGEVVGLIGPNGAGKTTLLRAALGLLPVSGGRSSLASLTPQARARAVAYLPQAREIGWPVPVEALVRLGRMPHLGPGAAPAPADVAAVDRAILRMGLEGYRARRATELSGGEQARALIARALAQDAPLLLADEPTAGLDPAAQIGAMEVLAALAAEGRGTLVSLHDLGLAARSCTRLVVMHRGRIVADGVPGEVLSPPILAEVFGIAAHLSTGPDGLIFQPLRRL